MEPWLIGIISGAIFICLLLIGLPVAYGLGIVGLALIALGGTMGGLGYLPPSAAFYHLASFALIALPLFILLSSFMHTSGMGFELFEFASRWLSRIPGALATASVAGCAGFAAMSGSSVATTAAIGAVAIPEMTSRGYNPRLAYGAVAVSLLYAFVKRLIVAGMVSSKILLSVIWSPAFS